MIDFFYNKFFNINNIGGGNPKKDFFFLALNCTKKPINVLFTVHIIYTCIIILDK